MARKLQSDKETSAYREGTSKPDLRIIILSRLCSAGKRPPWFYQTGHDSKSHNLARLIHQSFLSPYTRAYIIGEALKQGHEFLEER